MENINKVIAGPILKKLFMNICHSLTWEPIIITNRALEIFVVMDPKLSAKSYLFCEQILLDQKQWW